MGRPRSICVALGLFRPRDPKSQPLERASAPEKTMACATLLGMGKQPSTVEEAKQNPMEMVNRGRRYDEGFEL